MPPTNGLVAVTPRRLSFPLLPPSDRVSTEVLRVSSHSDEVLTFKVRTTNPDRYVVRPNIGIIAPGEVAHIQGLFAARGVSQQY
jgi:MSP (Major sperm protein) domain